MQQSTKKTLDEFKAWCNKWMLWLFGAVGCAVLLLIISVFMGTKVYQANERCDRLIQERDSIQYRENVFKGLLLNIRRTSTDGWISRMI